MEQNINTVIHHFNNREFELLRAAIAKNAVVKLPNGLVLEGVENIISKWEEFSKVFPDIQYKIVDIDKRHELFKVTVQVSGTFKHNMMLPNGHEIEATRKHFDMQQLIWMEFNEQHQLKYEHKEYDLNEFYQKIGIVI